MPSLNSFMEKTMANKSTAERNVEITVAAWTFATLTRDAKVIAATLDTTERNIYRLAETAQWDKTLRDIKYEGDRSFRVEPTRNTERDYGKLLYKTRDVYIAAKDQGNSNRKAAKITEEKLSMNHRTVLKWARRFGW